MNRFIYADLGAYDGDSIRNFYRRTDLPVDPKNFDIYAFEPNPLFSKDLDWVIKRWPNVVVSRKAAWINDGEMDYTIDKSNTPMGSTLMTSKYNWGIGDIVKVKCFDFSEWVRQFEKDYLIVKMDIEGAEFPILEKMMKEGTYWMMTWLWIETHPNKVRDYTTTYSIQLLDRLRQLGVKVEEWR